MKHAKFAPLLLLIFLSMGWTHAFAAMVYTPSSVRTMSADKIYCAGAVATRLSFGYNTCNLGTGTASGTTMTVNWYRNSINSTSGGTLVSTTSRTCRTRSTGSVTYTPSTTTAGVFYYYCVITWTGTGTCNTSGSLTSTVTTITVSAAPSAIAGSGTVCLGTPTTLTNTSTGGTWSTSNATVATVGSLTGIVSGVSAGTANITYRVACGTTVTKTVTVTTTPSVAAVGGGTAKICTGTTTTLTNATAGGVWSTGNSSVATVGTGGVVTGVASGITNISYAVTNTCGTTYATKEVTVTATPAAISGVTNLCAGYTTTYTNTVPYGSWTSSTAKATINASTGLITGVSAGTTLISYSTGCGAMATKTLTVNASIGANSGTATVCEGATTTLSNAALGGTWSSNNTSIATVGASTGVVTGVAAGTVAISYTTGGTCDAVTIVTVRATPASITGATTVCTGSTTPFANTSLYGTWSSSNAAVGSVVATTGVATGRIQGTTTISYTTGCGTAATKALTVYTTPAAIGGTAVVCEGATTTLTNSVLGGSWSTADATLATVNTTGVVTGVAAGLVNITYTNGTCFAVKAVTVNPLPNAGTLTGDFSLCDGDDSPITEDGDDGGTWSSTNTTVATIDATGLITAQAAGTSVISYTVSNSCGSVAATNIVTVNAAPDAGILSGTLTVCEAATTTLTAGSGGVWSSTNAAVASVGTAGVVSGVAAGTAEISYTYTNTCGVDVTSGIVTVNPLPVAGTITGTATVCPTATTTLSNATSGGVWTSGNATVATVSAGGVVTGVAAGTATISYAVTNSCGTAYATQVVTVNATPATGTITGTASICLGATSTLSNAAGGGVWSSANTGVATISSGGVVTSVAVGTSTISYAVTNVCGTYYATKVATVNALPAAITGTTTVCAGSTTTLADASAGGSWTSNNTSIATVGSATGVVAGVAGGSTTITYTMPTGCIATSSVSVTPLPVVTVPLNQTICNGATQGSLSFSSSVSGTAYSWTNSNPSIGLTSSSTGTLCGTASENGTLVLTAPAGAVFTAVTFASYGTPTGSCGSFATTACHAATSLSVVQSYVVGHTTASIPATNAVFGDPCVGTGKSLYVQATYSYSVVPSFVATNPGATAIVGTINVTPVANGCTGAPASFTITIDNISAPVAYAVTGGGSYCAGGSGVAVGLANSTVGINYQLKLAGVNVGSPVAGTGSAISFGLKTAVGNYTVEATNASTGCVNTMTGSVTVATSPVPDVTTPANQSLCNGATQAAIPLTGSLAGTVYSWAVSNTSIGLDTGRTGTICGTVAENGSLTLTAPAGKVFTSVDFASYGTPVGSCGTYSIGGCHASNSVTKVQTYLIGNNTATIPATNAVFGDPCSGTVKRLYVQASYGSIPSFTAVNAGAAPVVSTVTVTPTKNGCSGTPGTFTITVNNTPAAYAVTGGGSYCSGGSGVAVGLANSQTGINYQLKRGATSVGSAVAGTGSAISFGLQTTAGTYSVVATGATSGCTNNMTGSVTVSVGGSLAANTGTLSVCQAATTTLANVTSGGVWTSGDVAVVTIGTASGIATGIAAGTANVTYTSGGCSATSVVTVNPLPVAGTISGTATVCAGSVTALSSSATGGDWTSANTSVATVNSFGSVTGVAAGTATVTYSVVNSCGTATATTVVTVNPMPNAGTITGTAVVCEAATTALTNAATGGAWSSSDASIATVGTNGVVTGVATGVASISYTHTNSCGTAIATQNVTVNPLPNAGAITGTAVVCAAATTNLNNTATSGVWSSSNTSVATITSGGVVSGVAAGTSTISYVHTNSCGTASTTQVVTVNPLPNAGTITGTAVVCEAATTALTNAATGGVWSSSDATVATVGTNGVVTGVASGIASISYTHTNSCGTAIATQVVTVNPLPNAGAITGTPIVCAFATTDLNNTATSGTWSSSNTSAATITSGGVVSGVAAGTSTISYIHTNSCGTASTTQVVTVNPLPNAGTITGTAVVCEAASTALLNAAAGGVWSTGDATVATIATDGVVTGVAAGNATISYTVTNSCGTAYATAVVTVNPLPVAGTISGSSTVCVAATTALSNTVTGGTWTSANTAIATIGTNGVVTGAGSGATTISYTYTNSCGTAYATQAITALPVPSVASVTGAATVCASATTTFANAATGGVWSSSNAAVATVGTDGVVTGVAAGTAEISYTMSNACGFASASKTLTVNPSSASISGVSSVCQGGSTTFTIADPAGTWVSGAPSVATINAVTGVITSVGQGVSTITYTAATGCFYSVKDIVVNNTVGDITGLPRSCEGQTSALACATAGGTWSSSNTAIATVASSGVVTGVAAGSAVITYTAASGCYTTVTYVVYAMPAPITGVANICTGSYTVLYSTIGGSGTWSSSDTTVASADLTSGMITSVGVGNATITYKIPASGCYVVKEVTVNPTPAVITGAAAICAGSTQSFASATTGGTWSSSQTSVATIDAATGLATAITAGNTIVSYVMSTGCYRTYATTVNPLPATITYASNNICLGKTAVFASATTGGTWSSSNTAVGTIGSTSGVATSMDLGSTTITYRIPTGCAITTTLSVYNALANITGNDVVCKGYTTTLADATAGGAWYSGSTGIASVNSVTGVVTGMSAGTSKISYMLTGGCLTFKTMTVAAITGTPSVCVGLTAPLCHAVTGGTWSSSNTAAVTINATTGLMTGVAAGTAVITYNVGGGIYNTVTVVVNALPAAITGSAAICTESSALYTGTVGGSATWSSSDASVVSIVSTSGMATAISAGTATLTYKIPSSGCYTTRQITINPTPAVITGPATACVGTSITLASATEGGTWSSNPTTVATVGSTSGVVNATSAGGVTISYVLPNGCRRTKAMTVNASPAAITGPSTLSPGSSSAFSCATTGGSWTVTDAGVASIISAASIAATSTASASVAAVAAGVTSIYYTFTNGCWKSKDVSVVGSGAKAAATETIADAAADLKLYPNPTTGTFTVEASMNGNLSIYTFDGKMVSEYQLSGNTTTVALPSNLAAGIYICQFRFDDGSTKTSKLYFQN